MPLSAFCCRAHTFIEPVTAFTCSMLPEHKRKTSLYEDIERLPAFAIMRIAEWLTNKVDSLTSKKEATKEVGGAGHAALLVTCHHDTQQGRESGEELGTAARQWDLGPP